MSEFAGRWRKHVGLVIVTSAAIVICATSVAQTGDYERSHYSPEWRSRFEACFDERGNIKATNLEAFKREAESPAAVPPTVLAELYQQQGRWASADNEIKLATDAEAGNRGSGASQHSAEFALWCSRRTMAEDVQHGRYLNAFRQHATGFWTEFSTVTLPVILLALCVIVLGTVWSQSQQQGHPNGVRYLMLMALTPLFQIVLYYFVNPINSVLVAHDVSAFLTSRRAAYQTSTLTTTELLVIVLFLAVRLKKSPCLSTEEAARHSPPSIAPSGKSTVFAYLQIILLVVVGIILSGRVYEGYFSGLQQSGYMFVRRLADGRMLDGFWVLDAIRLLLLGPISEELLFRKTMYGAASRWIGPMYSAFLSSIIFAGCHGDWSKFVAFFWAGIVFVALYEVKRSVKLPIVVHCLHNLLLSRG